MSDKIDIIKQLRIFAAETGWKVLNVRHCATSTYVHLAYPPNPANKAVVVRISDHGHSKNIDGQSLMHVRTNRTNKAMRAIYVRMKSAVERHRAGTRKRKAETEEAKFFERLNHVVSAPASDRTETPSAVD